MFPVPTSAAKPTVDDIASVFCVSDGIPAHEKHGEDMSRHTSIHIQGKIKICHLRKLSRQWQLQRSNLQSFIPYIHGVKS